MDGPWKVYFRINTVSLEETIKFITTETSTKSIWYFHPNGVKAGPHIHGLLWDHGQTAETLRNKIKKFFSLENKTDFGISNTYSTATEKKIKMTPESVPTYVSYMSKGKFDPIYVNGYDNEYANARKLEWKEQRTIRISGDLEVITMGEVKTKRITMFQLANEAEDMYYEKYPQADVIGQGVYVHHLEQCVKAVFKKYNKCCPPRLCADIIGDICGRLAPSHYHSQVVRYLGMTPGIKFYT